MASDYYNRIVVALGAEHLSDLLDVCQERDELRRELQDARSANKSLLAVRDRGNRWELEAMRLEKERDQLRECMRVAGLAAFQRDRPPEQVAEHLRDVLDSYQRAATKAEAERDELRRELQDARESGRLMLAQVSQLRAEVETTDRNLRGVLKQRNAALDELDRLLTPDDSDPSDNR